MCMREIIVECGMCNVYIKRKTNQKYTKNDIRLDEIIVLNRQLVCVADRVIFLMLWINFRLFFLNQFVCAYTLYMLH